MWKDLEARRQEAELDPAIEAGSDIFELEGSYPGVQRLHALGAQVRAKIGQRAAQGEPEKPQERDHEVVLGVKAGGETAPAEEKLHSIAEVVPCISAWQAGILAHDAVDWLRSRSCS